MKTDTKLLLLLLDIRPSALIKSHMRRNIPAWPGDPEDKLMSFTTVTYEGGSIIHMMVRYSDELFLEIMVVLKEEEDNRW